MEDDQLYEVPCIPQDDANPLAPMPDGLQIQLHQYQRRSLHRMLQVEQIAHQPISLDSRTFLKTIGGVICDTVGMGKTALIISLVLMDRQNHSKKTLVVCPSHLTSQWKDEVQKFAGDSLTCFVISGDHPDSKHPEYRYSYINEGIKKANIVVLSKEFLAGNFYTYLRNNVWGGGYMPHTSCQWKRCIFDECHEVVLHQGKSMGRFMSIQSENMWCVSGTPFPNLRRSVIGIHSLLRLGIYRVSSDSESKSSEVEIDFWKRWPEIRKIVYLRNTPESTEEEWRKIMTPSAGKYLEKVIPLSFTPIERAFYNEHPAASDNSQTPFDKVDLRQLCCHPAVLARWSNLVQSWQQSKGTMWRQLASSQPNTRKIISLEDMHRVLMDEKHKEIKKVKNEIKELKDKVIAAKNGNDLVKYIPSNLHKSPTIVDSFILDSNGRKKWRVYQRIKVANAMERNNDASYDDDEDDILFDEDDEEFKFVTHYFHIYSAACSAFMFMTEKDCQDLLRDNNEFILRAEERIPELDFQLSKLQNDLASFNNIRSEHLSDVENISRSMGTKPAALKSFLSRIGPEEKVIVFSMYYSMLKHIHDSLTEYGICSTFLMDGENLEQRNESIRLFKESSDVKVLLLSLQTNATGTNLQIANHVVFVDQPGNSLDDAVAIETQAIGRTLRMGQTREVTVTRFYIEDTVEHQIFKQVSEHRRSHNKSSDCISTSVETLDIAPQLESPAQPLNSKSCDQLLKTESNQVVKTERAEQVFDFKPLVKKNENCGETLQDDASFACSKSYENSEIASDSNFLSSETGESLKSDDIFHSSFSCKTEDILRELTKNVGGASEVLVFKSEDMPPLEYRSSNTKRKESLGRHNVSKKRAKYAA